MKSLTLILKRLIPKSLYTAMLPYYHYGLSFLGAVLYRFPANNLTVIAVTGTKGKSSTAELLYRALTASQKKTALVSTIHFIVGEDEEPNTLKMTTPGRFFLQRFLRKACTAGCTHVVLELSSEAAAQYRHKFLSLNTLVFTNLSPEHIESHGSFDAYKNAKLSIRDELVLSSKKDKLLVVNRDDSYAEEFLDAPIESVTYGWKDAQPSNSNERGSLITFRGLTIHTPLIGDFNIMNALATLTYAEKAGLSMKAVVHSLEDATRIKGRVELVPSPLTFSVYVDYAHTADSLEKLYAAFKTKRKICVLGSCGGGRDKWKRPLMAKVADTYCDVAILTNEDPYDEDPKQILQDMLPGFTTITPKIILDRRHAIREALHLAKEKDVVLITGKGTDPYIMEAGGKKTPWSDSAVAAEEIEVLHNTSSKA